MAERLDVAELDLATGPPISEETLRRADLHSGLGLVASVLERHGGSLGVEAAPAPCTKAIAPRLFRAYPDAREAAA